jgi:hypothetical protein
LRKKVRQKVVKNLQKKKKLKKVRDQNLLIRKEEKLKRKKQRLKKKRNHSLKSHLPSVKKKNHKARLKSRMLLSLLKLQLLHQQKYSI